MDVNLLSRTLTSVWWDVSTDATQRYTGWEPADNNGFREPPGCENVSCPQKQRSSLPTMHLVLCSLLLANDRLVVSARREMNVLLCRGVSVPGREQEHYIRHKTGAVVKWCVFFQTLWDFFFFWIFLKSDFRLLMCGLTGAALSRIVI